MEQYNPFKPITSLSGKTAINDYLSKEGDFVAAEGYKDSEKNLQLRQYVMTFLQILSKELPEEPEGFDAFIPYLALNYFDNFISRNGLPEILKDVARDVDLLATCCLLKAGMIRNQNFNPDEFMGKIQQGGLQFEQSKMKKMELQIVNVLGKRIFPITAFCFLEYFATYSFCLYTHGNVQEFIIQSHADIYLAEFKPSVIAASALLVGVRVTLSGLEPDIKDIFVSDFNMEKEKLNSCMDKMMKQCYKRNVPVNVLYRMKPSRSELAEASRKEKKKLLSTKADPLAFIVDEMVANARTHGGFDFDWDYAGEPGSAQPSSSQGIATGSSVRNDYAKIFDEFGFAINWVDETEEVTFDHTLFKPAADSKLKGKLSSVMGFSCLKPQPDPDRK